MNNWKKIKFEVKDRPEEGETIQYAVFSVFQLRRIEIK